QQVGEVGMQPSDSAADARVQCRIEVFTVTQESVDQLLCPSPVPRIERRRAPIEGCIEQHPLPKVCENVRCRYARVRYARMGSGDGQHTLKMGDGRWEMGVFAMPVSCWRLADTEHLREGLRHIANRPSAIGQPVKVQKHLPRRLPAPEPS